VRVDDVLHAHRQSVQQAARARCDPIAGARLGERALRIEIRECVDDRLAHQHALEARAQQRLGGQPSVRERGERFRRGERVQWAGCGHANLSAR
jgi:hypothetical protein